MIKARAELGGGRQCVILGLSDENWRWLRNGGDEGLGQPISFDLSELGLPSMTVVMIAGRDEQALQALISEWF